MVKQARVFTLAAGIGLQADAGVTGGGAQPGAQLRVQLGIALALVGGAEGVDVGELGPGDGDHLAGGVELHGAGAQRNHAAVQRQVLVAQHADVAQHAGLGMVGVEHRVGHECGLCGAVRRESATRQCLPALPRWAGSGRVWQTGSRPARCRHAWWFRPG